MNNLKQYYKESKIEVLYFILCLIYLFSLNKYNHYLLTKYEDNDYIHMLFENTKAIGFFFILAIIIVAIAISFIYKRKNLLKKHWSFEEEENVAVSIISIVFNALVIVIVIFAINNPILQCILFGTMMLFALASQ